MSSGEVVNRVYDMDLTQERSHGDWKGECTECYRQFTFTVAPETFRCPRCDRAYRVLPVRMMDYRDSPVHWLQTCSLYVERGAMVVKSVCGVRKLMDDIGYDIIAEKEWVTCPDCQWWIERPELDAEYRR